MVAGALAFVLHGHLPYVRSRHPGSLEEDWFFQALTESYLPLIEMLQRSLQQGSQPRLTMSLSPTLLSLQVLAEISGGRLFIGAAALQQFNALLQPGFVALLQHWVHQQRDSRVGERLIVSRG